MEGDGERAWRTLIAVRALIVHREHLLLCRWQEPVMPPVEYFPVGGTVEFGESLEEALQREVMEETGCRVLDHRLVYTHENFFTRQRAEGNKEVREYGWFFWVQLDRLPLEVGQERPHPDHPQLRLTYLPLRQLSGVRGLYPEFLRTLLPEDWERGLAGPRRHVASRTVAGKRVHEAHSWGSRGTRHLRRWEMS